MHGEVKSSIAGRRPEHVSVDTGLFLNTVQLKAQGKNAVIFSTLPYAPFLEFGAGGFRGRRHFNNSLDRNKAQNLKVIQKIIKKL